MTNLTTLRNRLSSLRRARAAVRYGSALSRFGLAFVWGLAAIFVCDFIFVMSVPQRLLVFVVVAFAWVRTWNRRVWPLLRERETIQDLALVVEKQTGLQSDLIAALQFESPDSSNWGSRQLTTAVVDGVKEKTPKIDFRAGFSRRPFSRLFQYLAVSVALLAGLAMAFPSYWNVFVNRLLLGSRHYPSATQLAILAVNDRVTLREGNQPEDCGVPEGRAVQVVVAAAGKIPTEGTVQVRSEKSSPTRDISLRAATEEERRQFTAKFNTAAASFFVADLGRVNDPLRYQIRLGDASTDPASIHLTSAPVVDVTTEVIPPLYAAARKIGKGSHQLAVLDGSEVKLTIRSMNGKRLREVRVTADVNGETTVIDCVPKGNDELLWTLPSDSLFHRIEHEIRYEVQVTDPDGLELESPIRGVVKRQADRPPSGSLYVVHRVVLPKARPVLEIRASDDFGISRMALHVDIRRAQSERSSASSQGTPATAPQPTPEPTSDSNAKTNSAATIDETVRAETINLDRHVVDVTARFPVREADLPFSGSQAIALGELISKAVLSGETSNEKGRDVATKPLVKGDRVEVTLEVVDFRGDAKGESYLSDPIVLEISDENGVLSAISESDEKSERRLSDIIRQQLGIGESR